MMRQQQPNQVANQISQLHQTQPSLMLQDSQLKVEPLLLINAWLQVFQTI
jgi:hypothetical protein